MLRNFFSTPNVMGRLLIVLLLMGGLVFAGAFNGFVVQTDAKSCCGAGTEVALFASSASNGGCTCIGGSYCGSCDTSSDCSGSKSTSCYGGCECSSSCCTTGTTVCDNDDDQACSSVCDDDDS